MYTFESRIRYSEIDETGELGVSGLINYMQDCSTFHSEEADAGFRYWKEIGKAWLLASWRIQINRYPTLGEQIRIGTWPTGFRGIYGYRDFVLLDRENEPLARANSTWFLYDTKARMPIRVSEEEIALYGQIEPAADLGPAPRRIPQPEKRERGPEIRITPHYLDTNHHVNNARYIEIARDAAAEPKKPVEIRADYKKAAVLGDRLIPYVGQVGDRQWTISLEGTEEQQFAVVGLRYE